MKYIPLSARIGALVMVLFFIGLGIPIGMWIG